MNVAAIEKRFNAGTWDHANLEFRTHERMSPPDGAGSLTLLFPNFVTVRESTRPERNSFPVSPPTLDQQERKIAEIEGWILGVV